MPESTEGTNHLTVAESAELLGTTATKVLMLLRGGSIKGEEMGGEWFVEPDSLARCQSHGIGMNAAKGCAGYCSSSGCGCK